MMLDKGLIKYYIINSISEESKPSAGASKIWRKAPIFCNKNKNHNNNINNNNSYNKTNSKYLGCDLNIISLVCVLLASNCHGNHFCCFEFHGVPATFKNNLRKQKFFPSISVWPFRAITMYFGHRGCLKKF